MSYTPVIIYEGTMGCGMSIMSMQTTYNAMTAAAVDKYFNQIRHKGSGPDFVLNPDYKSRFLSFVDAVERRGNKIDG